MPTCLLYKFPLVMAYKTLAMAKQDQKHHQTPTFSAKSHPPLSE